MGFTLGSILSGIKAGAKYLASHIWDGLKSVFGPNAKAVADSALESAKQLLTTEVGQFIEKVVTELEASELAGPDRLQQATTNIKNYLLEQGKQISVPWIQWAIQTVLIFIRGLASPEATPPAV